MRRAGALKHCVSNARKKNAHLAYAGFIENTAQDIHTICAAPYPFNPHRVNIKNAPED